MDLGCVIGQAPVTTIAVPMHMPTGTPAKPSWYQRTRPVPCENRKSSYGYVPVPAFFVAAIVVCLSDNCRSLDCCSVVIAMQSPEHKMYYDLYSSYSARGFPQLQNKRLEIARLAGLAIVFNIGTILLDWKLRLGCKSIHLPLLSIHPMSRVSGDCDRLTCVLPGRISQTGRRP